MPAPPNSRPPSLVPRSLEARLVALACATLIVVGAAAQVNDWRTFLAQIDFSAYYVAGQALNRGGTPYSDAAPPMAPDIWYLYPPPLAAFMRLPALVPYRWLAPVWLAFNACITAFAFRLTWRLYTPRRWIGALVVLSLLAPASLETLANGQMNGLILLCLAAALWHVTCTKRLELGGALLGIATIMKLFPAALIVALPRRQIARAALGFGVVVLTSAVIGLGAGGGAQAFKEWPRALEHASSVVGPTVANQSLAGVLHRWSQGSAVIEPSAARRARLVVTTAVAGLTAAAVFLARARRPARIDFGLRWSIILIAAFILLPFSWDHYYVLLVLPAAILLRITSPGSVVWRIGVAGLLCVLAHRYANVIARWNVAASTGLGLVGCLLLWVACVWLLFARASRHRALDQLPALRAD